MNGLKGIPQGMKSQLKIYYTPPKDKENTPPRVNSNHTKLNSIDRTISTASNEPLNAGALLSYHPASLRNLRSSTSTVTPSYPPSTIPEDQGNPEKRHLDSLTSEVTPTDFPERLQCSSSPTNPQLSVKYIPKVQENPGILLTTASPHYSEQPWEEFLEMPLCEQQSSLPLPLSSIHPQMKPKGMHKPIPKVTHESRRPRPATLIKCSRTVRFAKMLKKLFKKLFKREQKAPRTMHHSNSGLEMVELVQEMTTEADTSQENFANIFKRDKSRKSRTKTLASVRPAINQPDHTLIPSAERIPTSKVSCALIPIHKGTRGSPAQ